MTAGFALGPELPALGLAGLPVAALGADELLIAALVDDDGAGVEGTATAGGTGTGTDGSGRVVDDGGGETVLINEVGTGAGALVALQVEDLAVAGVLDEGARAAEGLLKGPEHGRRLRPRRQPLHRRHHHGLGVLAPPPERPHVHAVPPPPRRRRTQPRRRPLAEARPLSPQCPP